MKTHHLIYAIILGSTAVLVEYIRQDHYLSLISTEWYVALIAIIFLVLGAWVGWTVLRKKKEVIVVETIDEVDPKAIEASGLSERELEVLQRMAKGFSNQEIADQMFVSVNTIKTHIKNIFEKLDVKRRTQAVQVAKEEGIIV